MAFRSALGSPCARLGQPLTHPGGSGCDACAGFASSLARVEAVGVYDGSLRDCVHRLKYRGEAQLADPLGRLMGCLALEHWGEGAWDLVVPVPLHRSRLRSRGFNQAELLARGVSKVMGLEICVHALERIRATRVQSRLSKAERFRNVSGAFQPGVATAAVANRRVLLIDDVYTTGSTANECARVLLTAGAREVGVLVLARGAQLFE